MSSFVVHAPAKINYYLDILDRRPDGFHNLDTVFQALDWTDELRIEVTSGPADQLMVTGPFANGVPANRSNLVLKALDHLRGESPSHLPWLSIQLTKSIPHGAGLGGGSSNAATLVKALNTHFQLGLSQEREHRLCATLGSDCPFFLRGGTQRSLGRGEILKPVEQNRELHILIAVSDEVVSTAQAFAALREPEKGSRTDSGAVLDWLAGRTDETPVLHNTFERGVAVAYPGVQRVLEGLRGTEPLAYRMSGSGSACFALYDNEAAALTAQKQLEPLCRVTRVCRPITP
mgnify:CR=1 FL=1